MLLDGNCIASGQPEARSVIHRTVISVDSSSTASSLERKKPAVNVLIAYYSTADGSGRSGWVLAF